jgi:cytochrome c oxidase subunit 4
MADRPISTLTNVAVCLALLGLTLATTLLGRVDLEPWNLVIALGIAAAKAALIAVYFMHLRHGTALVRLAVAGGVLWLMILLLGTMDDFMTRAWLGIPGK